MTTTHDVQTIANPQPRMRRRLSRTIARLLLGAVGALALIATAGAGYERWASAGDAAAFPMTGRLVDIGGYRLHLDCRGEGSPTVVLDAGLGGSSLDWSLVQPDLARTTRVCSYDRAGMGDSDPGPQPRTPAHIADELHALLDRGDIAGPFILVGHSLAGKTIRMFASAHPAEVAGMVLVDARSELVDATADQEAFAAALRGQAWQFTIARWFGVARLLAPSVIGEPLVDAELATRLVLAETTPNAIAATTDEGLARTANDAELASAQLRDIPLTVVAADQSMHNLPGWPEAQAAMAGLSTKGQMVVATNSGHTIPLVQPKLIVGLIENMVATLRSGRPHP
jgi:pimeloyl-ACP methyl ester carboxylesterase